MAASATWPVPRQPDRAHLPGADRPGRRHRAPGRRTTTPSDPRRAGPAGRHRRRRRGGPGPAAARPASSRPPSSARARPRRSRDLADDVDADTVVFDNELTPAQQCNLEKLLGPHRHRPHRGDPRHLRPERPQPGGQGPGRAGPAPLPPAPPAGPGQRPHPAGRRHRHPRVRARPSSRWTGAAWCAACTSWRPTCATSPATATPSASRGDAAGCATVAIVGYTNAGKSTLLNRLTDAGVLVEDRLFATLDPTTRRLDLPGGETVLLTDTVGFVRKLPHQLVEAFRTTLDVVTEADLLVHVVDASAPDPEEQIDAVRAVLAEIGAGARARAARVQQGRPGRRRGRRRLVATPPRFGVVLGRHRRGHRRAPARPSATGCGPSTNLVELLVPYDRGDILAAVHREGEVLVEQADDRGACVLRARLDDAAGRPASPSSSVRRAGADRRSRHPAGLDPAALPLRPPRRARGPAPRLTTAGRSTCRSARRPIRRPPPWSRRWAARAPSAGYPASIGIAGLREAAACEWMARRFGVECRPSAVAACVGTKEFVAACRSGCGSGRPSATPSCTRRSATRPTPWAPSWPAAGRAGAGRRPCRLDLDAIDPADAARALCLWVNTPGQPDRRARRSGAAAAWGRAHDVPVFSDECYVEFTWTGPPAHDPRARPRRRGRRALAVEALQPGRRAGRLLRRRPRAGRTTSGGAQARRVHGARPVQAAAVVAWPTTLTSTCSATATGSASIRLADILGRWGVSVELPEGGFYLWVRRAGGDGWALPGDWRRRAAWWSAPASSTDPTAPGTSGRRGRARGSARAGGPTAGRGLTRPLRGPRSGPGWDTTRRCQWRVVPASNPPTVRSRRPARRRASRRCCRYGWGRRAGGGRGRLDRVVLHRRGGCGQPDQRPAPGARTGPGHVPSESGDLSALRRVQRCDRRSGSGRRARTGLGHRSIERAGRRSTRPTSTRRTRWDLTRDA